MKRIFSMRLRWFSVAVILVSGPVFAQDTVPAPAVTQVPLAGSPSNGGAPTQGVWDQSRGDGGGGFLTGDKGFPNFIGYGSNPTKAMDPRSLTQIMPIYDYVSVSAIRRTIGGIGPLPGREITLVPNGEINVIGPALSVAVSERLNVGLTSGGPAVTSFPGRHQGWLDIGGYAQYTVIRDVPGQFLATAGMTWTAPTGSSSLFQGSPPVYLGTYGTVGKELGDFHFLTTVGFQFPAGSATATHSAFYGTVHVDRRCFNWLYPLVEFNWAALTAQRDLDSPFLSHVFGFDDFSANGNILTIAPGFNAVLVPDKLELGAVYQTPIASERNIHFNSFLVKMVVRF